MSGSSSINLIDSINQQMNMMSVDDIILNKEQTLNKFKEKMTEIFTPEIIVTLRTVNGNTQVPERNYIELIGNGLNELNFHYEEAGSQQSKDFRNINNTGLDIEVKKSDSFTIFCNDTLPNKNTEYLIIFTGKEYVRQDNIKPQLLFINGKEIIDGCDWLDEFQEKLNNFRDTYCRGENKKKLNGLLNVYIRPTYQFSIRSFLI